MSQIIVNFENLNGLDNEAILSLENSSSGFKMQLESFKTHEDGSVSACSTDVLISNGELEHLADMLSLMSRMIKNKLAED